MNEIDKGYLEAKANYKIIFNEIQKQVRENDPVFRRCRFVSFMSYSRGKDRKRKPREVSLLVVDDRFAFQVIRGELRPRIKRNFIQLDVLAQEVLEDVDYQERSVDLMLQRAIKNYQTGA